MSAKKDRGRPPVDIDLKVLKGLCVIGCTNAEIAAVFGCSERTIESRRRDPEFLAVMERGEAMGKVSLRRTQHKKALRGDNTMLVWLGKQRLGQKDKIETEHSGEIDGPPPRYVINFVRPKPPGEPEEK